MYIFGKIASVQKMRIFYDVKSNEIGWNSENISETKNKPLSPEELEKIQISQKKATEAHEKTEIEHKKDVWEALNILEKNGMEKPDNLDDLINNLPATQEKTTQDVPEVPISPEDQKIVDASMQNASAEFTDETVYKQVLENAYKIDLPAPNDGIRKAIAAESIVIVLIYNLLQKTKINITEKDYVSILKNPDPIIQKLKSIWVSEIDGKKLIDLAVTREKFGNIPKQVITDTKEEEKKPLDIANLPPENKKLVSMINEMRKNPAFSNDQKQQEQFDSMLTGISDRTSDVSFQVLTLKEMILKKIDPNYESTISKNTNLAFPGVIHDDETMFKMFSFSDQDKSIFLWLTTIKKQGEKAADENAAHNDQIAVAKYRAEEVKKDEYMKQQTQKPDSIQPEVVKTLLESPTSERLSYGSDLTTLPPWEPKVMELRNGPIIVVKNSNGTISTHDPQMNANYGLINIGPAEDFKENIRILNIGRNYPILQSLLATWDLHVIKKHMRYIETSLGRNGLTTGEYTTYLLSSLIELSGADKDTVIKPTFDKANFDKINLYFSEHQHDIQSWLLEKWYLNDQRILNRNLFLNSLSDPKKTV